MRKSILLAGLIALTGICVNAQTVAKSILLGGDVSVRTQQQKIVDSDRKIQNTQIHIMPMVGYFLTDQMAIGVQTGISSSKRRLHDEGDHADYSQNILMLSPFIRYYLTSGKVGVFGEGSFSLGYGFLKQSEPDHTDKGNTTQFSIGVSPGIYYAIHPKMMLEFSAGWLGYQYADIKMDGNKETSSSLGFDFGTTGLSLGLTFIL